MRPGSPVESAQDGSASNREAAACRTLGKCRAGRRAGKGCRGFSLIEVLVSIIILGVGLVGLTEGITAALNASKETELQANAALLAAGRIETLGVNGYLQVGEKTGQPGEGFSRYQWRQSIERTDIENLYEVAVTIESSSSGKQIYKLRTLLFEAPIVTNSWSRGSFSQGRGTMDSIIASAPAQ